MTGRVNGVEVIMTIIEIYLRNDYTRHFHRIIDNLKLPIL